MMTKWMWLAAAMTGAVATMTGCLANGTSSPSAANPTGCTLFDELNHTPGCYTPPSDPGLNLESEYVDGAQVLAVAVDGTYEVRYANTSTGTGTVTASTTSAAFTATVIPARNVIEVVASAPGTSAIHVANALGSEDIAVAAAPVANVTATVSRYVPLDAPPTTFFDLRLAEARLVDSDGNPLVDHSLTVTPDAAASPSPGEAAVTVSARSLHGSIELRVPKVDAIDDIQLVEIKTSSQPPLVCAHAMAAGHEVFATIVLSGDHADPISARNCVELALGVATPTTTVTATAGGLTRQLLVTAE